MNNVQKRLIQRPHLVEPVVKHYDWGSTDPNGCAAKLAPEGTQLPIAELWFGGQSVIKVQSVPHPLAGIISENPLQWFGKGGSSLGLNWLAKVLDIEHPLSIQLHPGKDEAERLHQQGICPDPVAKTEAALALTPVEVLCGTRPWIEILDSLRAVPSFRAIVGDKPFSDALSACETSAPLAVAIIAGALLKASEQKVAACCKTLSCDLRRGDRREQWVRRLLERYPQGDRGIFFLWLLNLEELKPGQAIVIRPKTPHAYLSGALFEIQAPSDNTLRGGLTSKQVHGEEFLKCADWATGSPAVIEGERINGWNRYHLQAMPFCSLQTAHRALLEGDPDGGAEFLVPLEGAAGMLAVDVNGERQEMSVAERTCFFIPAGVERYWLALDKGMIVRVCSK